MRPVRIGDRDVGPGLETLVVAEIGINHNGDLDLGEEAGRRGGRAPAATPSSSRSAPSSVVYTRRGARPAAREPVRRRPTAISSAAWSSDRATSTRRSTAYLPPTRHPVVRVVLGRGIGRLHRGVRSALLQDRVGVPDRRRPASQHTRGTGRPIILSTGMSSLEQIDQPSSVLGHDALVLHAHARARIRPQLDELNLRVIPTLARTVRRARSATRATRSVSRPTLAAVVARRVRRRAASSRSTARCGGATRRHPSSPTGFARLVKDIRAIEHALRRRRQARLRERAAGDGRSSAASMSLGPTTDIDVRAREVVQRSAAALDALARDGATLTAVVQLAEAVSTAVLGGGKVWLFGNGGSAAGAQHFAAELVGRFLRDRRALPAEALTANSSVVTSLANDYGFEQVFARQLDAGARVGDVAIGISTRGRSANVAEGLKSARELGVVHGRPDRRRRRPARRPRRRLHHRARG